jgi:hypothetical protein
VLLAQILFYVSFNKKDVTARNALIVTIHKVSDFEEKKKKGMAVPVFKFGNDEPFGKMQQIIKQNQVKTFEELQTILYYLLLTISS